MNILEVHDLTKRFKEFVAVDGISFSIKEGEILGFLGVNGAGKTTTIQMLLGALTPTQGKISYFSKEFQRHREEILEQVNFSSTYTNLPWDLEVGECLHYTSYLYDIKNRKERLKEIVKEFKLEPLLKNKIHELSAGEKTRVNLAKAFINRPKVLLLDEPTASLDPDISSYVRSFLLEQREKYGVSMLFTSHNMSEVEQVTDRVLFIKEGKIVADDTPEGLAKTVETSHIRLRIADVSKAEVFCKERSIIAHSEGEFITIDTKESKIAALLQELTKAGIEYDEISIKRPTLEDYFLELTEKKHEMA